MAEVIGQNSDGSYRVLRDDGVEVRVGTLPQGMALPRITPGSTAGPGVPAPVATMPVASRPASAVSQPSAAEMANLASFASTPSNPPPPPGAMPAVREPTAVDALVADFGMGPPKPRTGPPTEFSGFRGDPATMARSAATGMWAPSGASVHETPATARPDPIPIPKTTPAEKPAPLPREAFVDGPSQGATAAAPPSLVRSGPSTGERRIMGALDGLQAATAERIATDAAVAQIRASGMETEQRLAEEREARRLERQSQREEAARAEEAKLRGLLAESEKPQPEIDPNRLWNSKNTAQKILGALMEAFHGFAAGMRGQRHESRLRALIQEDIALQRDALQRASEANRQRVANQNLLLSTMRERFGDEIAADRAAEAYALNSAQQRLQVLMAKTDDKAKIAAGKEELAKLEVHKQNAIQDFRMRQIQVAALAEERQARAAAAGQPKPGPHVPAGEAAQVGEMDAARQMLGRLRQSWREKTGLVSGVTQFLPGTAAAEYADEAYMTAQVVGTILEGGKLTDSDFPKYQRMMPTAGDSRERADAKIANLLRLLNTRQQAKVKGLESAGFNTQGFQRNAGPASLQRQE